MQRRKWHRGACRRGGGEKLDEGASGAVEALEQGALTSLGGGQVGRQGGTALLEAGSGLQKLALALGNSGRAGCAGRRRARRKVRSQGGTPVGAVGDGNVRSVELDLRLACNHESTSLG